MLQTSNSHETRQAAREIKFLVSPAAAAGILAWTRSRLAPDPHAAGTFADEYRTTSLYFDTETLDVYHRRGSFKRCKYRVRRYGGSGVLFLERKLRTGTVLVKRRTTVEPSTLPYLASTERDASWPGFWFQRRLDARRLRPTCQVSYSRTARIGATEHGPMRLTCDRDIQAQTIDTLAFQPEGGTEVLTAQHILEMKFRGDTPAIFKHLIEEFALEPLTVSKYRLSLEALSLAGTGPNSDGSDRAARKATPLNA